MATTVGIFFIPLFFTVIRGLSERGLLRRRAAATSPPGEGPESGPGRETAPAAGS
jgi:hypothetical protein